MNMKLVTKLNSSDEGTSYYSKFLVVEGRVIGEVVTCNYTGFSEEALKAREE